MEHCLVRDWDASIPTVERPSEVGFDIQQVSRAVSYVFEGLLEPCGKVAKYPIEAGSPVPVHDSANLHLWYALVPSYALAQDSWFPAWAAKSLL